MYIYIYMQHLSITYLSGKFQRTFSPLVSLFILSPGHYVFGVRAILLKSGQLEHAEMLWASSVSSPVLISDVGVSENVG